MIKICIFCDLCKKQFDYEYDMIKPKDILPSYKNLREMTEKRFWIYDNEKWLCSDCAEYENAYKGKLSYRNRDNNKEWHYVKSKDLPEMLEGGITDTVLNQDDAKVFYSYNTRTWYKDDEGKTMKVIKWKYLKK